MYDIETPTLTADLADQIALQAKVQLRTSRQYKAPRMKDIMESEDLYFGVVPKTLSNPFNESFPFMSGFVDHLLSKFDDPPTIEYAQQEEADYKLAQKYSSYTEQLLQDVKSPDAMWALKDRYVKKMAIFSGVGIYGYYSESDPEYRSVFEAIDYYDFHCEPGGGGILENHLFCGQEGIFLNKEQVIKGAQAGYYDPEQIKNLVTATSADEYKQNESDYDTRLNRHRSLGLDPQSNNYVGQSVFKLVRWFTTYMGIRWYILFDDRTAQWIRIKPLTDLFSSGLYPYITWHTHEEHRVFWSKAPADDARPIARTINRLLNQELYNREKKNTGQRAYDVDMFPDVDALSDWRPDGLVPVDTKGGKRAIASGIYTFQVGELNGSIDLVNFLDSFAGQKTGTTPGSQGASEPNKKVGVYFGELKQIEDRLGLNNKSYRNAWAQLGVRIKEGLDENMTTPIAVKMMGTKGIEWQELKPSERRIRDFSVKIKGGNEDAVMQDQLNARKAASLLQVKTVNPRWKDTEILRTSGYTDEQIRDAYNMIPPASQELLSEAAMAIQDIVKGRKVKLNLGASEAYMQKLIDDATELDASEEIKGKIYDFAAAHATIVARNEARKAANYLSDKTRAGMANSGMPPQPTPGAAPAGGGPAPMPSPADFMANPGAAAGAMGQDASNILSQ